MIQKLITQNSFEARGIVGFYPANSTGDDISLYSDDDRKEVACTMHTLRQQAENDNPESPYVAMSDFVAPVSSGVADYMGMFAVSIFGAEALARQYEQDLDDYHSIMVKALADRFAEAFAEKLHSDVRKTLWGYATNESMDADSMFKVQYQGIRPAPGYPSQPDHTEKPLMWQLMKVQEQTGIELTDSLAMMPAAAVSGLYFANPHAHYFAVGKISKDQVEDYAARKHMPVAEVERWLSSNLAYDA
eukprot:TRINITY_DN645_c0_g2_i3.p1 TRINITY_DN645_c0_g2~~TRINITY_DN645_c0_g2_i3.p1  ORF type:complete len:246 (-),score=86.88 TRINITY_DN645_c0_g2_i3:234-971(-)